jgi:hypothetical protein
VARAEDPHASRSVADFEISNVFDVRSEFFFTSLSSVQKRNYLTPPKPFFVLHLLINTVFEPPSGLIAFPSSLFTRVFFSS